VLASFAVFFNVCRGRASCQWGLPGASPQHDAAIWLPVVFVTAV
jgi:hypothetical protein